MESITSRDNRLIKEGRRLLADAKYRRQTGLFLLEGARLCADAARSGVAIRTVLVTARAREGYGEQLQAIRRGSGAEAAYVEISEEISRHLGDTASPQGIFCICKTLDNRAALDTINRMGRYIALEDMQDPANLGTVVRTAEALGAFRLPFYAVGEMGAAIAALQARGMTGWACVVDPAATPVHKAALGPGSICVIGNEGNGLRPETAAACRGRLTIAMAGRAESLNASMAAGIILWELMRPQA